MKANLFRKYNSKFFQIVLCFFVKFKLFSELVRFVVLNIQTKTLTHISMVKKSIEKHINIQYIYQVLFFQSSDLDESYELCISSDKCLIDM